MQAPTDGRTVQSGLLKHGIIGGYPLARDYQDEGLANALVFCCTERNTDDEVERLLTALAAIGDRS